MHRKSHICSYIALVMLLIGLAGCQAAPWEAPPASPALTTLPATTPKITTFPHNSTPPQTTPPVSSMTAAPAPTQPEPTDDDFVNIETYIPDIVIDLRYATHNNFTGQKIYAFEHVYLRYGTVKKLMQVQEELKEKGFGLKIWDGFRPPSAQFKLWDICPDPTYVSNPNNGFSSHSRGNTVDITLVDGDGTELTMPTGFDDFSPLADRDYSDCSEEAAENALFLERLMIKYGFKPYSGEWWHFTDTQSYPAEQTFEPISEKLYYANCNAYISLRAKPSTSAEVITQIPTLAQFKVVARYADFALVEYQDLFGYVLFDYILPVD